MACGIPVAATEVGDVGRILPSVAREGLANPDDASFERALRRLLERRTEWEAWGKAGQEKVRTEYAQGNMIDAWRKVFRGDWPEVFRERLRQRNAGDS